MKTGIIGLILLLLVILGSFPTHARLINSVNVTCKSLDQKYKVGFNLSKASAKLFINNKEEGNTFTLTFPVCQSESSYFRFEQLKVKQYSFVYNK